MLTRPGLLTRRVTMAVLVLASVILAGCLGGPKTKLEIAAGSENAALEPLILDWAQDNGIEVAVTYLGSVDIARELAKGPDGAFDAVWPAHSIWIELGDTRKATKHAQSILRSPVVLGLRRSIARDLGWAGRDDITIAMIRDAAAADDFRMAMTSATQSNSGASAYLGFLYALAGNPDILTRDNLADPALQAAVRDLLATVDRSSGSSGWLKDSLIENPGAYDSMFNYESMILEANAALVAKGEEPLQVIYPADGLSVSDSPLAYVSKGDPEKETAFLDLQAFLLSPETQGKLNAQGRRAGLLGLAAGAANPAVWNPDWGVDPDRVIAPIPTPAADVIAEALRLYQTELRKPSLTIWLLDVSGSMEGAPLAEMKAAMRLVFDPATAAVNLLQPSARDISVVIPFNDQALEPLVVAGADPAALADALAAVEGLQSGGGTDLYGALLAAFEVLERYRDDGTLADHLPAIVALTDGASETGNRDRMLAALAASGLGEMVPIHAIAFGEADVAQLDELNAKTLGRQFSGKGDLAGALRSAKGYN